MKVKEKLDEEIREMMKRRDLAIASKVAVAETLDATMARIAQERAADESKKAAALAAEQAKLTHQITISQHQIDLMEKMQARAHQVLQELKKRGIQKVGRDKISKLEEEEGPLDYESIYQEFQNIQRKEKEAFEIKKKQKMNDTEIWTKAKKEEEKIFMTAYCEKHGKEEVTKIQKAIEDRHAKEVLIKQQLKSA